MANGYKVGSFTKSTSTSVPVDQSVTGVGFTPKLLLLFSNHVVTEDTQTANISLSIGASDGTNNKCIWSLAQDNVDFANTFRIASGSKCLQHRNNTTTALLAECAVKSFDSDGFTLTWSSNSAVAIHIKYIAIGDSSLSVEVGSFAASTSGGAQSVSTGIANADFLLLFSASLTTEDTLSSDALSLLGVASSTSKQGATFISSLDGQDTSNTIRYQRTDKILLYRSPFSFANTGEAEFNGFTASGFDLNWTTAALIALTNYYVAIKGGQWEVGNGTTATSATTKSYTTTIQADGLFLFGFGRTASTSFSTTSSLHIGCCDGTSESVTNQRDEHGLDFSQSRRISSSSKALIVQDSTPTIKDEASFDSFNATDFTLDFTTADATAREFIWMVCKLAGDASSSSAGGIILRRRRRKIY